MVLLMDAVPREWGLGMSKSLFCCCVVKGGLGQAGPVEIVWPKPRPCPHFSLSFSNITQNCFAGEEFFPSVALMPF